MSLRLIEVMAPRSKKDVLIALRKQPYVVDAWREDSAQTYFMYKILVQAEHSEVLIDRISRIFTKKDHFRIIVQDVEATLPLVKAPPAEPVKKGVGRLAISREELYNQVVSMSQLNYVYLLMVMLAAVIASFGFIEDKWVVVIGSMVVAPLIAPTIALSLGIVLGDKNLGVMGLLSMGAGVSVVLVLAFVIGLVDPPDFTTDLLKNSFVLDYPDIIVALASGAAGVLAFTSGTAFSLIGVMVAISLLPPLVAAGLVLGTGQWWLFADAMTLFFINLVALNLSGVLTFWFQGVRPKNWWEKRKARYYRRWAISLWFILLLILAVIIYYKRLGLAL